MPLRAFANLRAANDFNLVPLNAKAATGYTVSSTLSNYGARKKERSQKAKAVPKKIKVSAVDENVPH